MAVWRENRAGIAAMLAAPWMVEAMRVRAARGMRRAIELSPVVTGRYKASWRLYSGLRNGRAWARYDNVARSDRGAPYPIWVEWGNSRGAPRQRIAGRSMDAMRD